MDIRSKSSEQRTASRHKRRHAGFVRDRTRQWIEFHLELDNCTMGRRRIGKHQGEDDEAMRLERFWSDSGSNFRIISELIWIINSLKEEERLNRNWIPTKRVPGEFNAPKWAVLYEWNPILCTSRNLSCIEAIVRRKGIDYLFPGKNRQKLMNL